MKGIEKFNPDYIDSNISKVISTLGLNGNGWTSIMEILNFEPINFQRAHNLAKLMESRDLIETQFRHNNVIIKLTIEGWEQYEKEKPTFQ